MRCFDGSEQQRRDPHTSSLQGSESSGEMRNRSPETSGSESSALRQEILAVCYISPVSHRQFASPRLPLHCCAVSARPDPRVTQFDLRVSPTFLLSVLCAPLFARRSSQCDWFSRGAGALHAKGHERPLGDLAFPWRARERSASRDLVPVDPKTIQEYHGVLPFRSRHLYQTTSFLRDCRHQF